jgi:hypothetical protein
MFGRVRLGRRSPGTVLGLLVIAGTLLLAAPSAQAAQDTVCVGALGPVTVPGDLIVPEGQVCDLAGTRVSGNTKVEDGGELYAEQASLRSNVTADPGAYVELGETTVGGSVRLNESLGLSSEDSTIGGNIESRDADFIDLFGGSIRGNLDARGGPTAVFAEALDARGNLAAVGVDYFDLYDSEVRGNFSVRNTQSGSIFCGNTLAGNPEFIGNMTLLTIGSPAQACDGNTVSGNVIVRDNQAEAEISDNDIAGNLQCSGNVPAPTGGGNRVQGNTEGQCRGFGT